MKKTLKTILLLALTLLLVLSVATLVGCKDKEDPYDYVQNQGNTIKVVLDSTKDPLITGAGNVTNGYVDYRLKPGSPVPEPGVTDKAKMVPSIDGFVFIGYYEGTLSQDGTLHFGSKWDFSRKVTEDLFTETARELTLYGRWERQYKIHINFVLDGVVSTEQDDEIKVANNAATVDSIKEPTWAEHTFVQMYTDAACTKGNELTVSRDNPFTHGCTQEEPVREVYAKFIAGTWTLLRDASDLKNRISEKVNLYLLDDIDMAEIVDSRTGYTKLTVSDDYKGTIEGNGHTIRNLNFLREGTKDRPIKYTAYTLGLFARLDGATIRNVTFEDCTVSGVVRLQNDVYFYGFIAGQAQGECKFDNVTFTNCTLNALQFNISGTFDETAERGKIETASSGFVGAGSNYQPNGQIIKAQVNTLISLSATQACKSTTIFC